MIYFPTVHRNPPISFRLSLTSLLNPWCIVIDDQYFAVCGTISHDVVVIIKLTSQHQHFPHPLFLGCFTTQTELLPNPPPPPQPMASAAAAISSSDRCARLTRFYDGRGFFSCLMWSCIMTIIWRHGGTPRARVFLTTFSFFSKYFLSFERNSSCFGPISFYFYDQLSNFWIFILTSSAVHFSSSPHLLLERREKLSISTSLLSLTRRAARSSNDNNIQLQTLRRR